MLQGLLHLLRWRLLCSVLLRPGGRESAWGGLLLLGGRPYGLQLPLQQLLGPHDREGLWLGWEGVGWPPSAGLNAGKLRGG